MQKRGVLYIVLGTRLGACLTHQGCLRVQAGQAPQDPLAPRVSQVVLMSHWHRECLVGQVHLPQVGQVRRGAPCLVSQVGQVAHWTQVALGPRWCPVVRLCRVIH